MRRAVLLFPYSQSRVESVWGNTGPISSSLYPEKSEKYCLATEVFVQNTATSSYKNQLQTLVWNLGGGKGNKGHLITVPSCVLMMLPEFSAGAGEHRPRAGHTAMWFHFSRDEPLRRNIPLWKERRTYLDNKLTATPNPGLLFICCK